MVMPAERSSRSSARRMTLASSLERAERLVIVSVMVPGPVSAAICLARSAAGASQVLDACAREEHSSAIIQNSSRLKEIIRGEL